MIEALKLILLDAADNNLYEEDIHELCVEKPNSELEYEKREEISTDLSVLLLEHVSLAQSFQAILYNKLHPILFAECQKSFFSKLPDDCDDELYFEQIIDLLQTSFFYLIIEEFIDELIVAKTDNSVHPIH